MPAFLAGLRIVADLVRLKSRLAKPLSRGVEHLQFEVILDRLQPAEAFADGDYGVRLVRQAVARQVRDAEGESAASSDRIHEAIVWPGMA